MTYKNNVWTFFIPFIFLAVAALVNSQTMKPQFYVSKQTSAINFNYNFLKAFSLGNKRLLTDLLWIQTLMESDTDHYKGDQFNNWMYLRFNSIIELDPHFIEAYRYGGQYLSVIKDDDLGAKNIYDRGLEKFPDDYFLNYNAGFHYFNELGDLERSQELFEKIKYHPEAPQYLPSLMAKMKIKGGKLESALQLLTDAYKKTPADSPVKEGYYRRIVRLKATMDVECLNAVPKKSNCSLVDPIGNKYLFKDGKYYSNLLPLQMYQIK